MNYLFVELKQVLFVLERASKELQKPKRDVINVMCLRLTGSTYLLFSGGQLFPSRLVQVTRNNYKNGDSEQDELVFYSSA